MSDQNNIADVTVMTPKRGRPPGTGKYQLPHIQKYLSTRGIHPLAAAEVLSTVINERDMWRKVFDSDDPRVILSALQFLVSMRDGRPAQSINVKTVTMNLTPADIASAHQIIAEIRAEQPHNLPQPVDSKEDKSDE